jgi:integrase
MANVYKRPKTARLPEGAKLSHADGKTWATWIDERGRRRRAQTTRSKGKLWIIVGYREKWTARWTDGRGKEVHRTAYADKRLSLELALREEQRARAIADGLLDAVHEAKLEHERRPLEFHLADFERFLIDRRCSPKRVTRVVGAIRQAAEAAAWSTPAEIEAPGLMAHLTALDLGRAATQARLQAVQQFTRWLRENRRMRGDDPLIGAKLRAIDARQRLRRALSDAEIELLIDAAERAGNMVTVATTWYTKKPKGQGKRKPVPGVRRLHLPGRAMLYRVALGTGFRLSELRSLTPESFDLDADPPTVTVEAAYSKRRRQDEQPIRRDLAELLRGWLRARKPGERLWGQLPPSMAPVIAADLKSAGIEPVDEDGRILDFHALRHTFISRMANSGITPNKAMRLARHSTITLTMNVYTHVQLNDLSQALEAMPAAGIPASQRRAALGASDRLATGTDGAVSRRQR